MSVMVVDCDIATRLSTSRLGGYKIDLTSNRANGKGLH